MRPVEWLLRETQGDRQRARELQEEQFVEEARLKARTANLSINCQHAVAARIRDENHWCRNDGSNCLCTCHDKTIVGKALSEGGAEGEGK